MIKGKDKIDIPHPEAWDLLLSIDDRRVDYILYTPTVAGSLLIGQMDRVDASLQALEDAVYDTQELLNEYRRVRVLLHGNHFVLLPQDVTDEDCTSMAREVFPGDDGDVAVCPLAHAGVKIAYLMPRGMQSFLGRTFSYPETFHHLMPLCEHFLDQHSDGRSRMLLHAQADKLDTIITRDGKLLCANTYPFTGNDDAIYYAMSAWRAHGLDQMADEMQLTGDKEVCASLMPQLREFVKYVMPAEFPAAAMRLGRNALQAPLELILLALCE